MKMPRLLILKKQTPKAYIEFAMLYQKYKISLESFSSSTSAYVLIGREIIAEINIILALN